MRDVRESTVETEVFHLQNMPNFSAFVRNLQSVFFGFSMIRLMI